MYVTIPVYIEIMVNQTIQTFKNYNAATTFSWRKSGFQLIDGPGLLMLTIEARQVKYDLSCIILQICITKLS